MKKLFFVVSILFLSSLSIFSEEWKMCLGSYSNFDKAESQVKVLTENGIEVSIQEYKKSSSEILYRVLSSETLPSKQAAMFQKELLLNHPIIRKLNINNIEIVEFEGSIFSGLNGEQISDIFQGYQTELETVKGKLQSTQNELQKTQKELQALKSEFNKMKNSLAKLQAQKPQTKQQTPVPPKPQVQQPVKVQPKVEVPVVQLKRSIVIRDSDTGVPIPNADVDIDNTWQMKSDKEGKLDLPDSIQEGEHTITVKKGDEYVQTVENFTVAKGEITTAPQISIPKAVDFERIKIVLDWGEFPWDLDAHVVDGTNHVFFSAKKEGNLELDRDDVNSYGPETITILNPDKNKVYSYYVFDCSNADNPESTRLSTSQAQVKIYFGNEFVDSFKITPNKKGISWHVFDVVKGNKIVNKNKISAIKPADY